MLPLKLRPESHVVVDTKLARYLRRILHDPDIETYYHIQNKVWVVGTWVSRKGGVLLEDQVLGPNLRIGREAIQAIIYRRSPEAARITHERLQDLRLADSRKDREQHEEFAYYRDLREFLRKRATYVKRDDPRWSFL